MTKALAARLRELSEKATPGPWKMFDYTDDGEGNLGSAYIERDMGSDLIAQGHEDPIVLSSCLESEGDLPLIVELRNSLPAILTALEGAEETREALTKLAGFDYSTEEKIQIARAALREKP